MQRPPRIVGSTVLVATATALIVRALVAPSGVPMVTLGFGGAVALVGGVGVAAERESVSVFDQGSPSQSALGPDDLADVLAVTVAAGLTHVVSVHVGVGPVVASATVGLAAGVGARDVDAAAYCGSFVGMASPAVFPSIELVLAAGLIAGLAFAAATDAFVGFGGKLGTLALFGCVTTGLLAGANYATGTGVEWTRVELVVPVAVVAAVTTVVVSVRLGAGPVVGSALVGLVTGLVFPLVAPELGASLAAVAFCASFVGMSATDRLRDEAWVGAAGAVSGLVFVAVGPAFVGAGGKLGTTAFVSCIALVGVERLHGALTATRADVEG